MSYEAPSFVEDLERSFSPHLLALEALRGSHLVITGGTGFVGSWLATAVVWLNERHAYGTKLTLIARDLERFRKDHPLLAARKEISCISMDVRNLFDLPADTDWVIHAAASPDTRIHASSPMNIMSTIAHGTERVLNAAIRCSQLRMFLNISSGLVYGPQPLDLERIPEKYISGPSSSDPHSAYSEAKRFGETLCAVARSEARLPTISLRAFAFIGPFQSLDNPWAVTNFIRDAIHGQNIRVGGDGSTTRSYLYPTDMAAWILKILVNGEPGQVFNLGSPHGVALRDLAQKIAGHFKPAPEILLRTAKEGIAISRLVPDITAAERLGLAVTIDLDAALEKTIRWYRGKGA